MNGSFFQAIRVMLHGANTAHDARLIGGLRVRRAEHCGNSRPTDLFHDPDFINVERSLEHQMNLYIRKTINLQNAGFYHQFVPLPVLVCRHDAARCLFCLSSATDHLHMIEVNPAVVEIAISTFPFFAIARHKLRHTWVMDA